jgi:phosphoribosylamine--glycine ligase
MKVLIIGSGGREHAIAWKVARSPRLSQLYIAPGNPGTAALGENIALKVEDHDSIVAVCREKAIDLVVIGPEAPLAAGLGDDLRAVGLKVFGPSKAAAEIEASKAFSKAFMMRHNIPTARYEAFTNFDAALAYLRLLDYPVVIKASGLAAGKGVIVPEAAAEAESALRQVMLDHEFGAAGDEVVIEERLSGPEVSLIAFADGNMARAMVPAQDHKRVFDGDRGPNTGGMGAYAPVPVCPPEMVAELTRTILQPAVDGLRADGRPFVGVLYAGLMLTADGPRVIEFNCRFGDPETQVILPLLDSDILDIFEACADGRLADMDIRWKDGAAACVVLASGGYPGKYPTGLEIKELNEPTGNAFVFHAGTKLAEGKVVTSGGRVLCVSGWGTNIQQALDAAYAEVGQISFDEMHYRKDIGHRLSTDSLAESRI